MTKNSCGWVTMNDGEAVNSKLYRFCEKKIDQWLASHDVPSAQAEFRVSFNDEDDSNQVSCVTEIQLGEKVLRGCEIDVDTQAAFLHSLKRLHTTLHP